MTSIHMVGVGIFVVGCLLAFATIFVWCALILYSRNEKHKYGRKE